MGKPYEPNAIIKNDIEYILMERKPGGYRRPTEQQRAESKINKEDFQNWFSQIWEMPGASTKNGHPAPFPLELASRLVKMFNQLHAGELEFEETGLEDFKTMIIAISQYAFRHPTDYGIVRAKELLMLPEGL